MKLTVIFTTVLSLFATSPDLCEIPLLDADGAPYTDAIGQALSRYCEWSGPNVPMLDHEVCCQFDADGAACALPDERGGCAAGSPYYCEHGEVFGTGVVCYQTFKDACELGWCVDMPELPPPVQAHMMCCNDGACQEVSVQELVDCFDNEGTILHCDDGVSNADGTVTCFD